MRAVVALAGIIVAGWVHGATVDLAAQARRERRRVEIYSLSFLLLLFEIINLKFKIEILRSFFENLVKLTFLLLILAIFMKN